uniref:Polynucleotide adenylyltransferase n=1 Tax=Davidia involucrata TaxID=16924 RepID=A0A5B6ZQ61_DAVIN
MAISLRGNALLSRLKALLTLQRFNHTLAEDGLQAKYHADMGSDSVFEQGQIDISKWRKVDSRTLGITRSMISSPSWIVLKVLQSKGFEAYLVGGCVRDLLLNRIPKDFDVITTAALKQIKKQFHRAEIVGRRFPICIVHVKGSVIEVSSFETVAQHATDKEKFLFSQMPSGCDKKDHVRWRNCMHRDFTINSLFYDPFVNKIYDYVNGMMDLRSLKLRTLIPAQLSFKEDCARILRGLRIAARLGLSFSKETETAICKLSSSIICLAKSRIMMELNYMLSYGAAESSLCLLGRFNLLDILLPFQAAYLSQQTSKQSGESSVMFMKLFFNLDKLVTCDQPSDCSLWVGLLAFHLALVNKPQDALVVWTFASVMYHGEWKEGVKFARKRAQAQTSFVPEISEACDFVSDDELAGRVSQLAQLVQYSVDTLTETDRLLETMARFPELQCSGLVFVPKKTGNFVAQLFSVLVHNVESFKRERKSFEIDYHLLGKGNLTETRFVLGKVIMDTMSNGIVPASKVVKEEKDYLHTFDPENKVEVFEENFHLAPSDLEPDHIVGKEDKKCSISPSNELQQERAKKQNSNGKECNLAEQGIANKKKAVLNKMFEERANKKQEMIENKKGPEDVKMHRKIVKNKNGIISQQEVIRKQKKLETCQLPPEEMIMKQENALEKGKCQLLPEETMETKQKVVESEKCQQRVEKHSKVLEKRKCHVSQEEVTKQHKGLENCHLPQDRIKLQEEVLENKKHNLNQAKEVAKKNDEHQQEVIEEKCSRQLLSSLFK